MYSTSLLTHLFNHKLDDGSDVYEDLVAAIERESSSAGSLRISQTRRGRRVHRQAKSLVEVGGGRRSAQWPVRGSCFVENGVSY